MPELPEVETIRLGLARRVVGKQIAKVEVWNQRMLRTQPGGIQQFSTLLEGAEIKAAVRRGKFLWLELNDDQALVIHLGMSGQVHAWDEVPLEKRKHEHIRLTFTDGTGYSHIDQRTFGKTEVVDLTPCLDGYPAGEGTSRKALPESATHIARDPLDAGFNLKAVATKIRQSQTAIKTLLLKQELVSGIGNIYADEALFQAGIRGSKPGASLTQKQAESLLIAAKQVMEAAVKVGGTSFDALYVNVSGEPGYFAINLQVYGRNGKSCYKCGTLVEKETIGGRSHHFCGRCQPLAKRKRKQ
ncbi:bifunctional DNA-formamidopyrimidine glycosylase/DNA-(apurinic or apyrimidinic site) lyase [Gleimia sp. 6138-11-ORH1]|uniref:bifunctional DNA-formamidopyrimidine glycosylase/DNA-(apurinic or apyrimidinic site) lyase n=1 Tax=Gleimia sp. 6138-11-ORH1 TaxID=2973937 RepID=UPI002168F562|nr:bifunctional DNA-formamidopyrimidine glycosylase/DNA-(apurinic or apyrimidinic site) lyase [Gleimia sp. 6138-11-ORH1]MCS4484509.1 bifunctional DNA-formamidopyrimidine glycosylase/DNA-(apurinic or apyrimidinic site) lyase [Gleimia sp. 6138-11-ORH1]